MRPAHSTAAAIGLALLVTAGTVSAADERGAEGGSGDAVGTLQPESMVPATSGTAGSEAGAAGDVSVGSGDGSGAAVPEVVVEAALSATDTDVGRPVNVTVRAAVPAAYTVASVRVAGNPYVETVDTVDAGAPDGAVDVTVSVAVFRSGAFTAVAEILAIDGDGNQLRFRSDPFTVRVASSIVNESNPDPAASDPPMPVLTRDMRPIWAGVGLASLALGFLISALWRARSRVADAVDDSGPKRPAWEIAFEALDALEADAVLDEGRHLEFHMRLSEILRAYVGARFAFLAPEMTTTEIGRRLESLDSAAGRYREEIVDVLQDMDLVKFARFVPPRDMSEACLTSARRLVEELSARERELAAAAAAREEPIDLTDGRPGADEEATPPAVQPSAHAPSPSSTTGAFAPQPDAEPNVVRLPRPEDRS